MSTSPTPGIRNWRKDSGIEPIVRIGVVLAEDAMDELRLSIPDGSYRLEGDSPLARGELLFRRVGNKVSLSDSSAEAWTIRPTKTDPPRRGDGILVRGVVAGRGFHWNKRVDQTLAGAIRIVASERGLVLVNELPLESYLASVITSEMSSRCPIEFLRAQCITARSWLLAFTEAKHDNEPFDRCNDDCCQRYQGTGDLDAVAIDAAESTRGLCLLAPDGRIVDANYSKSCGGIVELPEHVWRIHKPGLAPAVDAPAGSHAATFLPVTDKNLDDYLHGQWLNSTDIYCSPKVISEEQLGQYLGRVDVAGRYFRWTVCYSDAELLELLKSKEPKLADARSIDNLRVLKRGISGRAIEIAIDWTDGSGAKRELRVPDQYRIRQLLHKSFLFSSAFAVRREPGAFTLDGAGWGHGAGLCQIGALGMAIKGLDHAKIVKHYFPDSKLKQLYS